MAHGTLEAPSTSSDDQDPRSRRGGRRVLIASTAITGLLAAGTAVGVGLRGSDKDPGKTDKAEQGTEQTVGNSFTADELASDGTVEYLVVDPNNPTEITKFNDRNGDGQDDAWTDVNGNDVPDAQEPYDPASGGFVDTTDGQPSEDEALADATEQELSDIAEIAATFPSWDEYYPDWKAEYTKLDPVVQERVMFALHHPDEYQPTELLSAEEAWEADVHYQFSRTRADIEANQQ